MARRLGCGLFVYTGSSSSYGDVEPPFHEDGPTRPYTPYAISKQVGETYVRSSGISHAIFRLFNVYGPGDPPGRYRNAVPNMMAAIDDRRRTHPDLRPTPRPAISPTSTTRCGCCSTPAAPPARW